MFALPLLVLAAACSVKPTHYRDTEFDDVSITRDVAYGSEPQQRLDVYQAATDTAPKRPGLIWIHGGGFNAGDRTDGPLVKWPSDFAKLGYVAVSIDYTLGASEACIAEHAGSTDCRNAMGAAATDARAAVVWMRENAATYRVDPDRIAIAGESAGGITASIVATTASSPADAVKAFVSVSGGLPTTENVDAGDPPGCLISNTKDPWIPYDWSKTVADALHAAGVASKLRTFDEPGHVPAEEHGTTMFNDAKDFLYRQLDLAHLG
jgi:dienelactone hydrolase